MELFVVMDKSMLGRGVFGVFSSFEKALSFSDKLYRDTRFHSEIRTCAVIGKNYCSGTVYAAHSYSDLYDTHIFDGIYSEHSLAYDAIGNKGLLIRFVIDSPDDKKVIIEE